MMSDGFRSAARLISQTHSTCVSVIVETHLANYDAGKLTVSPVVISHGFKILSRYTFLP